MIININSLQLLSFDQSVQYKAGHKHVYVVNFKEIISNECSHISIPLIQDIEMNPGLKYSFLMFPKYGENILLIFFPISFHETLI